MLIIGVDPGQAGAFAVLDERGQLLSVFPMPMLGGEPYAADVAALLEAAGRPSELFVGIEEPFANNRASSISQMTQGQGHGILLGVVGVGGYRHDRIKPAEWKRIVGLPMSSKLTHAQKKNNSRALATQLWPHMAEHWAKANQDGFAEAALIGEAVRRKMLGATL